MLETTKKLKYDVLIDHLRKRISQHELLPGDRVPSLSQMQLQFQVSRGTVEKAYMLLEQEGILVREQGSGTFVAEAAEQNKTKVVGLIFHANSRERSTPYTMDLLTGVHSEAAKHDLQIHWVNPQDEKNISRENIDAVLMLCHPTEAVTLGLPQDMPQVLLFQHSPDITCVVGDDFEGGKLATQHLIDLGHRRIACILASNSNSISRERVAGYHAALEDAGIAANESWVRILERSTQTDFRKSGEMVMQNWLKDDWNLLGCTAIVAHNDETAIGIIQVLKTAGLQVPEDISVLGFDGTELCELTSPRLTSIEVPLREIGERAIKVLLEQIQGGAFTEPQKVILPVQLKLNESTAPLMVKSSISH